MSINYTVQEIDGEQVKVSKRTGKPLQPYNRKVPRPQNIEKVNTALDLPEGQNTKYIHHVLECQQISVGVNRDDIEDLKKRFIMYLELCRKNDMKVGNLAAYCALGITKDIAFQWEHGRSRGSEHTAFIKFVKSVIAAYRETALSEGEINPVLGIFWQKSFDGLNEMTESDASNMLEGVTEKMDAQAIADKYQDLLPE